MYGHLSKKDLIGLDVGKKIEKGELIAHFGEEPENGNWPPHLHFQVMTDLLGWKGDFPGVCKKSEKDFYASICINPNLILRCSE